jgi:hypothetical protein
MRRTTGAALALLAGGTVLVAACSSSGSQHDATKAQLVAIDQGGPVSASDTVPLHTPYIFNMRDLCTRSGKAVTVTKVVPARPVGGIRVADWGIRYDHPGSGFLHGAPGGLPGHVSDLSGFSPHTAVTVPCGEHAQRRDEFAVSLARSSPKATMAGLWLYYGTGQRTFAQYAFKLCASKRCPLPRMPGN